MHYICDSEEYWTGDDVEDFKCVGCGSVVANVGVGFSLYDMVHMDVRWVSVGVRCVDCGILGCIADWKVGYGDSRHFLDEI
jgi:hypothetical protein